MDSFQAGEKQRAIVEGLQKDHPEWFVRTANWPEAEVFQKIGIYNMPEGRARGYIRLYPQDFIVEEELKDGSVVRITDIDDTPPSSGEGFLTAHLIKVGLPTGLAIERLAHALGTEVTKIGYAGLKDASAVTAQVVSLPKIPDLMNINWPALPLGGVRLTRFHYQIDRLWPGSLSGNRFTITVRTDSQVDEGDIRRRLQILADDGLLNYYQAQRFEESRIIAHELGKLLLQGNHEEALKKFLFETNPYDIPYVTVLRQEAEALYPNFSAMMTVWEKFPHTFHRERRLTSALLADPGNFVGALTGSRDQTQMWVYAYASYLFNEYVSRASLDGELTPTIPLLLSTSPRARLVYGAYLKRDGITDLVRALRPFKFIRFADREQETLVYPRVWDFKVVGKNIVIHFSLPKGAYATTFLANLFVLQQYSPIPDWVARDEFDPKAQFGNESIVPLKEYFGQNWRNRLDELDPSAPSTTV